MEHSYQLYCFHICNVHLICQPINQQNITAFSICDVRAIRRGFLFLLVLGMGCVLLLWHSLYNFFHIIIFINVTLRSRLPRIARNLQFLGFVEFLDFLCPFVMFYVYVTTQIVLRMFSRIGWIRLESHEYWQDSIIYNNIFGNTARKLGMNYELVKNVPKAWTNPTYNSKVIRDSSLQFVRFSL